MTTKRPAQLLVAFMAWTLAVPPCAPDEQDSPGFVVVVNAENPTTRLPVRTVSKIFLKRVRRWEGWALPADLSHGPDPEVQVQADEQHDVPVVPIDLVPVVPIDLLPSSAVRKLFSRAVMRKSASAVESFWHREVFSGRSSPPKTAASAEEVLEHVRSNAGAIAYLAEDVDLGEGVRVLEILYGDTRPTQETRAAQETEPPTHVPPPAHLEALAEHRPRGERRQLPEQEEQEPEPLPLILNDRGTGSHVGAVAVDPRAPGVVYAGSRRGVFKSQDHGATWVYAGAGLEVADVHALAVDPKDGSILYAGTHGGGVFKSLDRALSWQPARQGLVDPVIHSLEMDPHDTSIVYAGTRSGIYASTDGGALWKPLYSIGRAGNRVGGDSHAGRALAFYPADPLRLTGALSNGRIVLGHAVAGTVERLQGSFDLGARALCGADSSTACLERYGIDPRRLAARDLEFAPGGTLYAATLYGVWRYDRDGASWDRFPVPTNAAALAVAGRSVTPEAGPAAAGLRGTPRALPASDAARRDAAEPAAPSVRPAEIYSGGANGIFVSGPDGRPHERVYSEPVHSLAIHSTEAWRIYAGSDEEQVLMAVRHEVPDAPVRYSVRPSALPSHLRPKPTRPKAAGNAGKPRASGPATPRPEKLTPAVLRLFRGIWATPATDLELRAALALELEKRVPEAYLGTVRDVLGAFLEDLGSSHDQRVRGALFGPGGRWLATSYLFDDGHGIHSEVRLYDLVRSLHSPSNPAGALRLEPGGLRPELVRWRQLHDLAQESVHLRPTWVLPDPGAVLAWSENGRFVATQPSYDRLAVWPVEVPDVDAPRVPRARFFRFHFLFGDSLEDGWKKQRIVALSDDGRFLAAVHHKGQETFVRLVRLTSGSERVTDLPVSPPGARQSGRERLLFSPDNRWLLTFGTDGAARRWDVRNPSEPSTLFHEVRGSYREVRRSPDGLRVAACAGSDVLVWRLGRSGPGTVQALPVVGGTPSRLVFSPDGRWLAVDASREEVLVWNLAAEDPAAGKLRIASDQRLGVFSADSRRYTLQTSGNGEPVMSWDLYVKPIRPRRTVTGSAPGRDALFEPLAEWPENREGRQMSHDGRWFVEASHRTLRLWEFEGAVPRAALAQVDRYGPVGIHGDERAPPNGFAPKGRLSRGTSTCAKIGRGLTLDEWRFFLKDEPYKPSC